MPIDADSPAVVVCHGLWLPGAETGLLRRRLAGYGLKPYLFRYRTVRDGLDDNAVRLAELISRLPERTVELLGYSLGGVIAIAMIRAFRPQRVERLVCLGSPLNGSASAAALLRLPGGRRILGRSMSELVERGGLGRWDGSQAVGVVAGRLPWGLGRLLRALPGPNDGTVAVAETRLPGIRDHVVRNVSHTSMLFSAEVAADAAKFLRTGSF